MTAVGFIAAFRWLTRTAPRARHLAGSPTATDRIEGLRTAGVRAARSQ